MSTYPPEGSDDLISVRPSAQCPHTPAKQREKISHSQSYRETFILPDDENHSSYSSHSCVCGWSV